MTRTAKPMKDAKPKVTQRRIGGTDFIRFWCASCGAELGVRAESELETRPFKDSECWSCSARLA